MICCQLAVDNQRLKDKLVNGRVASSDPQAKFSQTEQKVEKWFSSPSTLKREKQSGDNANGRVAVPVRYG